MAAKRILKRSDKHKARISIAKPKATATKRGRKSAKRTTPSKPKKPTPKAAPLPAKPALAAIFPDVTRVAFTANSQALLLARTAAKTLTLYDLDTRAETPPLKALANCSAIALSADSRLIAMGTSRGDLVIDSAHTGKTLWKTKLTSFRPPALR
jgi:hypothetical protein